MNLHKIIIIPFGIPSGCLKIISRNSINHSSLQMEGKKYLRYSAWIRILKCLLIHYSILMNRYDLMNIRIIRRVHRDRSNTNNNSLQQKFQEYSSIVGEFDVTRYMKWQIVHDVIRRNGRCPIDHGAFHRKAHSACIEYRNRL